MGGTSSHWTLVEAAMAAQAQSTLTQQHELIRSAQEYGDLFAHAATPQGQQP